VEVGDVSHGQAGQVSDRDAFVAADCNRQRADRGGLVDDQQHRAVLARRPAPRRRPRTRSNSVTGHTHR
jgi:hypothetical protein